MAGKGTIGTPEATALDRALATCRRAWGVVALFSLGVNILMLASPIYMLQVYDRVLGSHHLDTLIYLSIILVTALAAMAAIDGVRSFILARVGTWLDHELSPDVMAATMRLAVRSGGARAAQGLRDLQGLRAFLSGPMMLPLFDVPWVPLYLLIAFMMHWVYGVITMIGLVVLFLLAAASEVFTREPLQAANTAGAKSLYEADAAVKNADVIAAMGIMPNLMQRWLAGGAEGARLQLLANDRALYLSSFAKFFRQALQSAILGFGAWLVIRNEITGGMMIAASIIMGRALSPVEQAIGTWRGVISARQQYRRLGDLLRSAAAQPMTSTRLPRPAGQLVVDKASYIPPQSREPVVRQVSFALEPGDAVGVIGPSAAGKTTLMRLIVGSLPPTAGSVRLDGAEMAIWNPDDRGQYVGYLPQDIELFNGTVRENIARLGEADDADVVRAAQLAGAHDTILALQQGYDTKIGDGGVPLSGGQRQRIGLARALYGDPALVVLDEPNSNLDGAGEQALIAAIARLREAKVTVVMVAQRMGAVAQMDKILLLRAGAVEAFGPREEVLGKLSRAVAVPPGAGHPPAAPPQPMQAFSLSGNFGKPGAE